MSETRGFVTVKVEGMEEIARTLRAIPTVVTKAEIERMLLSEVAPPILNDMRAGAPRSAGMGHAGGGMHAADTITALPTPTKYADVGEAEVEIGPTKRGYYLQFLEWGTYRRPATPFMRPAWDAHADETPRRIGAGLWRIVQSAVRSA